MSKMPSMSIAGLALLLTGSVAVAEPAPKPSGTPVTLNLVVNVDGTMLRPRIVTRSGEAAAIKQKLAGATYTIEVTPHVKGDEVRLDFAIDRGNTVIGHTRITTLRNQSASITQKTDGSKLDLTVTADF